MSSNLRKSQPNFRQFSSFIGQKSVKFVKNLVNFLGDLKTPKFHSEIKLPLEWGIFMNNYENNKMT